MALESSVAGGLAEILGQSVSGGVLKRLKAPLRRREACRFPAMKKRPW